VAIRPGARKNAWVRLSPLVLAIVLSSTVEACGSGVMRNPLAGEPHDARGPLDSDALGDADAPDQALDAPAVADAGATPMDADVDAVQVPVDALLPDAAGTGCDGSCPLSHGAGCAGDGQCLSGHCVDGRCCQEAACYGDCNVCLGAAGTCVSMTSSPVGAGGCGSRHACNGESVCKKVVDQRCAGDSECLGGACVAGSCACKLCLSPDLFDMGTVPIATVAGFYLTFTVKNADSDVQAPFEIALGDGSASGFAIDGQVSCGVMPMPPQGQCQFALTFHPTTSSSSAATIELRRGAVVLARASVAGAGEPGDQPWIESGGPDLGDVVIGNTGRPYDFRLTNPASGGAVQPIFSIAGHDPLEFRVSGSDCPATLAPGANCPFFVRFMPSGVGNRTASVVASGPGFRTVTGVHGRGQ
jgi:hypothetical protein